MKYNLKDLPAIIITSLVIALIGWIGLFFLLQYTQPFLGPRWLFFFLLTMAISGTALPLVYFLNLRFPSEPPANTSVIIRQALWFAIFVDLLAWLQLGRVLNSILIVVIALGIIAIENLIRLVERSHWQPSSDHDE
ncbi:MAG TPA: hypothetical protein VK856_02950 [Anaerolineaceae bacterium]|nr:hypothetical protein [Anaerolineaceae bacterium]